VPMDRAEWQAFFDERFPKGASVTVVGPNADLGDDENVWFYAPRVVVALVHPDGGPLLLAFNVLSEDVPWTMTDVEDVLTYDAGPGRVGVECPVRGDMGTAYYTDGVPEAVAAELAPFRDDPMYSPERWDWQGEVEEGS
jgi:hypothetical protein